MRRPNTPVARDRLAPFGVSVVTELPGDETGEAMRGLYRLYGLCAIARELVEAGRYPSPLWG